MIDIETTTFQTYYYLFGLAFYNPHIEIGKYNLIQFTNCADGYDYYFTFNSRAGMMSQTEEGDDKVLVVQKSKESIYSDSYLIGRVGQGDNFLLLD